MRQLMNQHRRLCMHAAVGGHLPLCCCPCAFVQTLQALAADSQASIPPQGHCVPCAAPVAVPPACLDSILVWKPGSFKDTSPSHRV